MGVCFLACFGSSLKGTKSRYQEKNKALPQDHRNRSYKPLQPAFRREQNPTAKSEKLVSEVEDNIEKELSSLDKDKVIIRNHISGSHGSQEPHVHSDQDNVANLGKRMTKQEDKLEEQLSSSSIKKATFETNEKTYEPVLVNESTKGALAGIKEDAEKKREQNLEKSSSLTSSVGCYPSTYRYNNCQDIDEEEDELESEESNVDDDDSDYAEDEDLGNCEIDNERIVSQEMGGLNIKERKSKYSGLSGDRSIYVHPVLNPVENLAQWKASKTKKKTKSPKDRSAFGFESNTEQQLKKQNQGIAVDASLANWLVPSQDNFKKNDDIDGLKIISLEKSILKGMNAMTVEELRECLVNKSPDEEVPIVGSAGTYKSHSGRKVMDIGAAFSYKSLPNTTSKYSEVLVK